MIPITHHLFRGVCVASMTVSVVAAAFGLPLWVSVASLIVSGACVVVAGVMVRRSLRRLREIEERSR